MISANNITLRVGKKALFEDVNIKLAPTVQENLHFLRFFPVSLSLPRATL
mgnify:CR=1 FL=1